MNSLESLKQELILQKNTIENMGGKVIVEKTNPSPAEITKGLSTLDIPDLSGSNATEADVLAGKTFYSGSDLLRVGTFVDNTLALEALYEYEALVQNTEQTLEYRLPTGVNTIRPYMFYQNYNRINFSFNSNITSLGSYCFAYTPNFTFPNLHELTKITTLPDNCFRDSNPNGLNFEAMPPNLEVSGVSAFINDVKDGDIINVPDSLRVFSTSSFNSSTKKYLQAINFNEDSKLETCGVSTFNNIVFNCDFVTPANVSTIYSQFNYNGSFNNIVLGKKVKYMYQSCFNVADTCPLDDIRCRTITFLSPTPPTTYYASCFSLTAMQNGCKIYVPDESIDEYKAKMSTFVDYIYPASEKE